MKWVHCFKYFPKKSAVFSFLNRFLQYTVRNRSKTANSSKLKMSQNSHITHQKLNEQRRQQQIVGKY